MKIFGLDFGSPKEAKNETTVKAPINSLPSAAEQSQRVDLGNKEELAKSISVKMEKLPHSLFAKNLEHWADARAAAMNPYYPRRFRMSEVYSDALNDLHLAGCIEKRILKITNKKFKLLNPDGKRNDEATARLNKQWFRDFRQYAMESRPHGFSLIELLGDKEIAHCNIVDRRYVVPEFGIFITGIGDTMGYDYNAEEMRKYCVPVGKPTDHGWLMSLSIYAFIKKAAIGNWAEFAEIFGMPMRIAKVNTTDKTVRADVEQMLDEMGSAAWGLFPMGTEVDIKGDNRTDSYKVYDMIIERMNSEMSKKVLGSTMTMDNGSSRSQAEVHEREGDEITTDDKAFMFFVVNDILLPRLVQYWGFPEGLVFDWDDAETLDLTKRSTIDLAITQMGFKPTKQYIEDTYSIELDDVSTPPLDSGEGAGGEVKNAESTAKISYNDITGKINELYGV